MFCPTRVGFLSGQNLSLAGQKISDLLTDKKYFQACYIVHVHVLVIIYTPIHCTAYLTCEGKAINTMYSN